MRALDHFLICVAELETAAVSYSRLGFHVRPMATHEDIGSRNCVVHFSSTYLELFDVADAVASVRSPYDDFLQQGEGLAHVSLTSSDLPADRARLANSGIEPGPVLSARRKIILPDGKAEETDSRCFYTWRDDNRYLSLFLSEHGKPETIFIPEYEQHPNTVRDVSRVVYMSTAPADDIHYFSTIFGGDPVEAGRDGFVMIGSRSDRTEVLSVEAARRRYGALMARQSPAPLKGLAVAMHYSVDSLQQCADVLERANTPFRESGGCLEVPASSACGCVVVFEEAAASDSGPIQTKKTTGG